MVACLGENRTVLLCTAAMAVCFTVLNMAHQLWQFMVMLVPISAAAVVLATVNTGQLTKVGCQDARVPDSLVTICAA